jgi:hypothetical protein
LEEVERAMRKMKRYKTFGIDEWVNELFLFGGNRVGFCMWKLFQRVWEEEEIPGDWSRGVVFPFEGEKRDPLNYRGITLLSVAGKLFSTILNDRLMEWSEENEILVDEQGGFRPGRGCVDQAFILNEVLVSRNRNRKRTYCCFIDIKKAYDRVFRDGLWCRMAEKGIRKDVEDGGEYV